MVATLAESLLGAGRFPLSPLQSGVDVTPSTLPGFGLKPKGGAEASRAGWRAGAWRRAGAGPNPGVGVVAGVGVAEPGRPCSLCDPTAPAAALLFWPTSQELRDDLLDTVRVFISWGFFFFLFPAQLLLFCIRRKMKRI